MKNLYGARNLFKILISSNFGNIATYQELISSSSFKLIYAAFNNSLKPYNPEDKSSIDTLDIKRILEHYKSEEFLNLINQELTFGYSIYSRVKRLDKGANELILKIEKELNKNHD